MSYPLPTIDTSTPPPRVQQQQQSSQYTQFQQFPSLTPPQGPQGTSQAQNININPKTKRPRLRVSKACNRCKKHKIKCNGELPCAHCVRNEVQCAYSFYNQDQITTTFSKLNQDGSRTTITIDGPDPSVKHEGDNDREKEKERERGKEKEKEKEKSKEKDSDSDRNNGTLNSNGKRSLSPIYLSQSSNSNSNPTPNHNHNHIHHHNNHPRPIYDTSESSDEIQRLNSRIQLLETLLNSVSDTSLLNAASKRDSSKQNSSYNGTYSDSSDDDDNVAERTQTDEEIISYYTSKGRYGKSYTSSLNSKLATYLYNDLPPESQKLVSIPRVTRYGWNMSGQHYLGAVRLSRTPDLIDNETSSFLVDYFMKNINPLFCIIHDNLFRLQLAKYQGRPDTDPEIRLFTALFHIICCIAMRFSEFEHNKYFQKGLEEKLFSDAHQAIESMTFEYEYVEIIQGWLLICLYLRVSHRQTSCWNALGRACHMAKGMGLNANVHQFVKLKYHLLKRQRVFWSCYMMDRIISIETGRPFSIRDDEISLPFPVEISNYKDDTWSNILSHSLLRLTTIMGKMRIRGPNGVPPSITKYISSFLKDWNEQVKPFGFGSDTELNQSRYSIALIGHLRLIYNEILYEVNAKSLFPLISKEAEISGLKHKTCLKASKNMVNIVENLINTSQIKIPWWLPLSSLYNAGNCFIILINSGLYISQSTAFLTKTTNLLEKICRLEKYHMAKECTWALKTLNNMISLRLSSLSACVENAGIDHGNKDVNNKRFGQLGKLGENFLSRLRPPDVSRYQNDVWSDPRRSPGGTTVLPPISSISSGSDNLSVTHEFMQPLSPIAPDRSPFQLSERSPLPIVDRNSSETKRHSISSLMDTSNSQSSSSINQNPTTTSIHLPTVIPPSPQSSIPSYTESVDNPDLADMEINLAWFDDWNWDFNSAMVDIS